MPTILWTQVLRHPLGISLGILVLVLGGVVGFYHFVTVPRLQAAYKLELANYQTAHLTNVKNAATIQKLGHSNTLWKSACAAPVVLVQQQAKKQILAQQKTQQQREYAAAQQRQVFYKHNTAGNTWAHTLVPLLVASQFRPPS